MSDSSQCQSRSEGDSGLTRAIKPLLITEGVFLLAAALAFVLQIGYAILIWALFILVSVFITYSLVKLTLAKAQVLQEHDVALWKDRIRLVAWNPTEGVVFLKNKQIQYVDDSPHDGGGIRVMYPVLGEEMVLRVPLEIQTLAFKDSEVLTKEYMPLAIQGTMYWKICDLKQFYLCISKELHTANDRGGHSVGASSLRPKFEVAEQWLRLMAEEKTRMIVSKIGTGLLIADQLASDLPKALPESAATLEAPQSSPAYRSSTEGLAHAIKNEFETAVKDYGLEIHRVALQEIKLPPEIYAAAVDACKAAYLPLKAKAEALERKMKLQADVDVIGKDAVGMREIAGNIPALAFQEFLAPLFLDFNRRKAGLNAQNNPA